MKTLASSWRGIVIIVVSTVIDISVRFATSFNMEIIVPTEAVLFIAGSVLLFLATRYAKRNSIAVQKSDLWIALGFLLAGTRAALWATGFSVGTSNLVILVFGIAAGSRLYFWIEQEQQEESSEANDHDAISH